MDRLKVGWMNRWMDGWYIMLLGSLALPDWVRHTWRDQGHQRAPLAPALQTWKKAANARSGPKLEKVKLFRFLGRIMLWSIFTPIHTTLNYLAILLMVRFCNAVRCWSASHVEHGVKDQVASAVVRFPNCIVYSWVYNTQKTVKFDFDCFHSLH